jgi:UDP-glucuronate decarboxylase
VQRCPDIERAQVELGWQPKVPLREGLQRTIAYFDRVLSGEPRAHKAARPKPALALGPLSLSTVEDPSRRLNNVQR